MIRWIIGSLSRKGNSMGKRERERGSHKSGGICINVYNGRLLATW